VGRRVLIVESGTQLAPVVREAIAAFDPTVEIDLAHSMDAAVGRLADLGYDLIVSAAAFDGARAGLFLRHLCARRFPTVPFLLMGDGANPRGAGVLSPRECLDRIRRLL
jgi:hypothetical protein